MEFVCIKRTHPGILAAMRKHYSKPKGFVGRNICYEIRYNDVIYGYTVGGSATRFLPGRNGYLDIGLDGLNNVANNIFFHVERVNGEYPFRNFVPAVIAKWRQCTKIDWLDKYGDRLIGFETLVELPRTGECYRRDGWTKVGQTKGYTCKRVAGKGTDSWTGKRVWDTKHLRPKWVFCKRTTF